MKPRNKAYSRFLGRRHRGQRKARRQRRADTRNAMVAAGAIVLAGAALLLAAQPTSAPSLRGLTPKQRFLMEGNPLPASVEPQQVQTVRVPDEPSAPADAILVLAPQAPLVPAASSLTTAWLHLVSPWVFFAGAMGWAFGITLAICRLALRRLNVRT